MLNLVKKLFGTKQDRDLKAMMPTIRLINSFEDKMKQLSDSELQAQTQKFKQMIEGGATLESLIPEAFATVREASRRVLKMRHFDVQLMGGIVLFEGRIAEMKTGEGKTLTATLPLFLHGLTSKGAHLVTVNDYLASRDAKEMGELLEWLGLTVGCIVANMDDDERQEQYRCDVTYGTNNEFAFDYLRDNMKFNLEDYVQRPHNFCIVDEVDSILIDEARTPLLISGPSEGNSELYAVADKIIPKLKKDDHYTIDEKAKSAIFTDDGITTVQKLLSIENLFDVKNTEILHHLNQALKAHAIFKRDTDYVVKDDKVIIVDEFTGRLKDGSRWSDGLHQAVEAKEGVQVKSENQTLASITFQNYFKLYDKLSGMTGTADTEAEEFGKIYKLDVVVVPTNLPMVRKDRADLIYKTETAKYKAVTNLIKELYEKGQPVLVGTISIENSEKLSRLLGKEKVPHQVLNAKQHSREADIILDAGQPKTVTIATNMAGRGTDIKLPKESLDAGGLFIIGTERHDSRRIDNQLRGRSGRQGDPGESRFFLSLEDDLMRIFGSARIQGFMNTLGMDEDEPIEHKMISNAIAKAQKKVEGHNFEIRKHLLEYDNVMNEQRSVIYKIRKDILSDNDNMGLVSDMIEDVSEILVDTYKPERKLSLESWNWEELNTAYNRTFNTELNLSSDECFKKYDGVLEDYFSNVAKSILKDKFSQYEDDQVKNALRQILLSIFDHHWKDHLLSMDHMKEGINLRAYAQKDPLTEYKRESFNLFQEMRTAVKKTVVESMFTVTLYTDEEIEELEKQRQAELEAQLQAHKRAQKMAEEVEVRKAQRGTTKIGRNEPCPCGSGKKFKNCHGA